MSVACGHVHVCMGVFGIYIVYVHVLYMHVCMSAWEYVKINGRFILSSIGIFRGTGLDRANKMDLHSTCTMSRACIYLIFHVGKKGNFTAFLTALLTCFLGEGVP